MAATSVDFGLESTSDFTANLWFDIPASGRLQIQVNGVITEITASGAVPLAISAGFNLISYTAQNGAIVAAGSLFDGVTSRWVSPYPFGQDPFMPVPELPAGHPFSPDSPSRQISPLQALTPPPAFVSGHQQYMRVRTLPSGGAFVPGTDWVGQFGSDPSVILWATPIHLGSVVSVGEVSTTGIPSILVPLGTVLVVRDTASGTIEGADGSGATQQFGRVVADQTTAGLVLVNVAGISFTIAPLEVWVFFIQCRISDVGGNGASYAISAPVGAALGGVAFGTDSTANDQRSAAITAFAPTTASFNVGGVVTNGILLISGTIINGANAGTIQMQQVSILGDAVTVFAGSFIAAFKTV